MFPGRKRVEHTMADDLMHYDRLVENALLHVVRGALSKAAEEGIPGSHHFYIGFRTGAPDVDIPEYLRQNFPEEMTIVLQHRFWGLEVAEDAFEVTLSFNKRQERLHIPFAALTSFFDPSVQFGLQFQQTGDREGGALVPVADDTAQPGESDIEQTVDPETEAVAETEQEPVEPGANIVALDTFRKK